MTDNEHYTKLSKEEIKQEIWVLMALYGLKFSERYYVWNWIEYLERTNLSERKFDQLLKEKPK